MIEQLIIPFQFNFMISAFWIMSFVSVPTAFLSCYLVVKGWSLMGDAISHAVLPGIILAYLLKIPLILGAFCAGMICALAIGFLNRNSRVKQNTIIGIVFSGMFGVGLVIHTKIISEVHLESVLFGNMLSVSFNDLWISGIISLGVSTLLLAKQKDILLECFDPVQAQAVGISVRLLHYGMLAMISLTVVATLSAVGIILSIGLLIIPGAIAFLLTNSFKYMLLLASCTNIISSFFGIYLSFFIDSAPAPTIILMLVAFFILALILFSFRTYRI